MTMSWAVTAWPPVGGLGGRITHRHPRTASTYTNTHTYADSYTHGHRYIHAQKPTHYLNSLDLTLHTAHLTDNSHSDFLRDEKCFRATRRLVILVDTFFSLSATFVQFFFSLFAWTTFLVLCFWVLLFLVSLAFFFWYLQTQRVRFGLIASLVFLWWFWICCLLCFYVCWSGSIALSQEPSLAIWSLDPHFRAKAWKMSPCGASHIFAGWISLELLCQRGQRPANWNKVCLVQKLNELQLLVRSLLWTGRICQSPGYSWKCSWGRLWFGTVRQQKAAGVNRERLGMSKLSSRQSARPGSTWMQTLAIERRYWYLRRWTIQSPAEIHCLWLCIWGE